MCKLPGATQCPSTPHRVAKATIHHPLAQVREAYLQFMTSVAIMLRKDLKLPRDNNMVREEMAQVLDLEIQLANVRRGHTGRLGWARC